VFIISIFNFLLFTIIMLNNKNLKLISIIKKYINNDPKLYVKFNHYNRKYPIDELMPYIIEILEEKMVYHLEK